MFTICDPVIVAFAICVAVIVSSAICVPVIVLFTICDPVIFAFIILFVCKSISVSKYVLSFVYIYKPPYFDLINILFWFISEPGVPNPIEPWTLSNSFLNNSSQLLVSFDPSSVSLCIINLQLPLLPSPELKT